MSKIHITDIELAINYWRHLKPSTDGMSLCPEVRALAEPYAIMAVEKKQEIDEQDLDLEALSAWLVWYETTPDTPCIAICSTSQGDAQCNGCGRSFAEVQLWTEMSPAQKRQVWRRITLEAKAWRFNRYAERARESNSSY